MTRTLAITSSRTCILLSSFVVIFALAGSAAARLQAPGKLVVGVGVSRIYTRSELRPGATVACRYENRTLSVTAPTGRELGNGAVWPKIGSANGGLFHLNVDVTARNAYSVTCGLGGHHW